VLFRSVPILSHINPIHTIPSYLSKIHFNIEHPPTSWSSQWSPSFRLSHQYPICIPPLPIRAEASCKLSLTSLFYGELLAPRSTPKLEDHPLSAVRDCLFIYSQLPSKSGGRLLHPQSEDAPCRGDKSVNILSHNKIILVK
jgi:hypothetical protein